MKKVACLFAGQGAQYPGMGKQLFDSSEAARGVFKAADEVMPGISALCFEGSEEALAQTRNTQPAVLTVDVAAYAALCELGFAPDAVAGFSLGEYAALVASGAMGFAQALAIVQARALWMSEVQGAMMAVLGLQAEAVETLCNAVSGVCEPVNYNCPGQTVVAGTSQAIDELALLAKAQGAKTARLAVSCPSHSSLMRGVGEKLRERLEGEALAPPGLPFVANATGDWAGDANLPELLSRQVMSPVRWEQGIRTMIASGVTHFVEAGPGKTLCGFLKRIERSMPAYNVADAGSLDETAKALGLR